MTKQLARVQSDAPSVVLATQLAPVQPTGLHITAERKELLKRTICKGATDDEPQAGDRWVPTRQRMTMMERYETRRAALDWIKRPTVTGAAVLLALSLAGVAADGSPPVTVPSTSPEPVPCGIDAAADPCASPEPIYTTPVAVEDVQVSELPATGMAPSKSVRPLLGFFGLLIMVVVLGWYSLREPEDGA